MTLKHYLPLMAVAMSLTAFSANKEELGINTGWTAENMDTSVKPGIDFFQYACGGWMKLHPLTAEYARFGNFELLAENNLVQLKELVTGLAGQQNEPGSVPQKIGDLYNLAMDSTKLNKEGMSPIKTDMARIAAIKNKKQFFALMTELQKEGVPGFFYLFIDADIKNSKENLVQIYQGGLSLGEKEYYLDTDDATKNIREKFKLHLVKMFRLAGYTEAVAQKKMQAVMKIETRIAKKSKSATEQRDPAGNYHKMKLDILKGEFAGIDWDAYFHTLGLDGLTEVSVSQKEPLNEVVDLLATESLTDLKSCLEWNLLNSSASFLSDRFVQEDFNFYGKVLSGKTEIQPRWKRSINTVDGVLGEAVGEMYVKKYFSAAAKERMLKLVKNLQTALAERIQAQAWMSDITKQTAIDKLHAFYVKVGYPDKFRDYTNLEIKKDSYWNCIKRAHVFNWNYIVEKKYGKPVDRDEWGMTPQTVNAYYNPTTNEICFPAGILQYPFFDMNADDSFNYGAIGVVIGHEMTHGFDDQGRQFDKNGNLKDWWTKNDGEMFRQRTQTMADFFSKIEVLPGLKANGELTLGENLADHGGLMVAYQAFQNAMKQNPLKEENGFTPDQRFFLSFANVWACNIREEEIRVRTKSDPHSLARWRVNGSLPNIDAWYDAFHITPQDPMFVEKDKRVDIW